MPVRKMITGKPISKISVRTLVEFLLRSGDLDSRSAGTMDPEAAIAGARIHRKLQKNAKDPFYESEVRLQWDEEYEDLIVRLEGRADGVIRGRRGEKDCEPGLTVEEIKSLYLDVRGLDEPFEVHLAQAKCYAAMLLLTEEVAGGGGVTGDGSLSHPDEPDDSAPALAIIRMTYVNIRSEEIRQFEQAVDQDELLSWFHALLQMWHRWAAWELMHRESRNASMERLEFPFPYREGQRKLTAAVYHAVREGKSLFLMAPTGVGKTMSCVFPAVRALGEGYGDRIFYLTAKNETLRAGEEAFALLAEAGLDLMSVRITAKEKICPMREPSCNPEECRYAKGHFDRVNDAVFHLISSCRRIGRGELLAEAEASGVCPFELSLDTASWCDAVLCDYNYAFDPNAQLKRFFANSAKGDGILLIDEAHNLVERAREMYSAALVKEELQKAKRKAGDAFPKLKKAFERVNRQLLAFSHLLNSDASFTLFERPCLVIDRRDPELTKLIFAVISLCEALQEFYREEGNGPLKEELLDTYFAVCDFVHTSECLDDHYIVYAMKDEDGHLLIKLFCATPAARLTENVKKGRMAVFFSATLLPVAYYREMLTEESDVYAVYARSPFDTRKRLLMIASDISTKFTSRGPVVYERIAEYIFRTARGKCGNYLVFFPSYKMMREVFAVFRPLADGDGMNWVMQSARMLDDDREIFLENFYEDPAVPLVGFCVMGGMFSEGLDLIGTRLIGAIVVGAGLPQVSHERELLKRHYDGRGGDGFDYAYRYPGLGKVEQSAGRVIRTETDRGVILLLDSRLLETRYRKLFPKEWENRETVTLGELDGKLAGFWGDESGRTFRF